MDVFFALSISLCTGPRGSRGVRRVSGVGIVNEWELEWEWGRVRYDYDYI